MRNSYLFLFVLFLGLCLSKDTQAQMTDVVFQLGQNEIQVPCGAEGEMTVSISGNGQIPGDPTTNYFYPTGQVNVLGLCPSQTGSSILLNLTAAAICNNPDNILSPGDIFFIYDGPMSEVSALIGSDIISASNFLLANQSMLLYSSAIPTDLPLVSSSASASGCVTIGMITTGMCDPADQGIAAFNVQAGCIGGNLPFCSITSLNLSQANPCNPASNTFSAEIDYDVTHTLLNDSAVVMLDGMEVDTIEMPTGAGFFTVSNIPSDGNPHGVTVFFLDQPFCSNEVLFTAPASCVCEANPGTLSVPTASDVICSGETVQYSLDPNAVPPLDANDPLVPYLPGIAWALYSGVPTISAGDVLSDANFVGLIPNTAQDIAAGGNITLTNNPATIAQLMTALNLPGAFNAPITFYIAPITMYNYLNNIIAVEGPVGVCSGVGSPIEITMVPPINVNALPTSCAFSNAPFSVSQGTNAANPISFDLSGLTPATATFLSTTVSNGGIAQINNLVNGDNYSFTITDPNGCTAVASGGPFVGTQTPVINAVPSQCESNSPTPLFATPAGGTWSGPGVVGSNFDPGVAGTGTWNLTYTVGGACGGSASIEITVLQDQLCITGVEQSIGTPSIVACGGFLVDNGMTASDYSANANDTTVVCPDLTLNLDPITNLFFNVFDLGLGDQVFIYDGNSTNSPLIGQYSGIDLSGQNIYSTDATGCLTVVFESNSDASVGNISAEISCGIPCINPVVNVTIDQPDFQPARICPGETVTFDASATEFFNDGVYVSHEWQWDDGTIDTSAASWPVMSHTFTEEGGYLVQLLVTDSNGCTNSVLPDILIFAATNPTIALSSSETDNKICTGVPLDLNASFETHTWIDVPTANLGGALYIPDDQSQCFSDTLNFSGFEAGATIQSTNDILSLFINFEHSYMGDISISYTCPDGSMIVVHQNGGGGTFLGEPIDVEDPNQPGVGYDYFWSPTATNGTWVANINIGSSLQAGEYQSVQPFDNLVGCPLNGNWVIEVCDGFGADDGFIFDWAVNFAPYMYPDLISFTPSIGTDCDSSYWTVTGGGVVSDLAGLCDSLSIINNTAGNYTYTYHLLDNHGCEYSQDYNISIYEAPVVDAGPVATYCQAPLIIPTPAAHNPLQNPAVGMTYNYTWNSAANNALSSTTIAGPTINGLTQSTYFSVTVTSVSDAACFDEDSVLVNFSPQLPDSTSFLDSVFCLNDEITLQLPDSMINSGYNYEWYFNPIADSIYYVQTMTINPSPTPWDYTIPSVFPTTFIVRITDEACNFQESYTFLVGADPCTILIPNIFTPNGIIDQTDMTTGNNSLYIEGLFYPGTNIERFPGSTLKVFNRWGTVVYESESYKNDWTGEDQSEGTYFYVFMQNFADQDPKFFEGYITLIR